MTTTFSALEIRRRLGLAEWSVPEEYGSDGWLFDTVRSPRRRVIVSDYSGGWIHASISRASRVPDYGDLTSLHQAVWGDTGWSYQVFAPVSEHINIARYALHLWGHADGSLALPNFGRFGTI